MDLTPIVLRPLVDARFQVLFHSPHRGSFHLSLTVLVRYRSSRVFSLGQWSALLPTGFLVPCGTQATNRVLQTSAYRALTVSGGPFQCPSASPSLPPPGTCGSQLLVPPTHSQQRPQTSPPQVFGLLPFRSPLLREYSLLLWVLRCFSSPRSPAVAYVFSNACLTSSQAGFPIRIPPDLRPHTAPRGFSQCTASFFGP